MSHLATYSLVHITFIAFLFVFQWVMQGFSNFSRLWAHFLDHGNLPNLTFHCMYSCTFLILSSGLSHALRCRARYRSMKVSQGETSDKGPNVKTSAVAVIVSGVSGVHANDRAHDLLCVCARTVHGVMLICSSGTWCDQLWLERLVLPLNTVTMPPLLLLCYERSQRETGRFGAISSGSAWTLALSERRGLWNT